MKTFAAKIRKHVSDNRQTYMVAAATALITAGVAAIVVKGKTQASMLGDIAARYPDRIGFTPEMIEYIKQGNIVSGVSARTGVDYSVMLTETVKDLIGDTWEDVSGS